MNKPRHYKNQKFPFGIDGLSAPLPGISYYSLSVGISLIGFFHLGYFDNIYSSFQNWFGIEETTEMMMTSAPGHDADLAVQLTSFPRISKGEYVESWLVENQEENSLTSKVYGSQISVGVSKASVGVSESIFNASAHPFTDSLGRYAFHQSRFTPEKVANPLLYLEASDKSKATDIAFMLNGMNSACNILTNDEFDNSVNDWSLFVQSGSAASLSINSSSLLSGTNAAQVDVTSASGTDWHVQLAQQTFSITSGTEYAITFDARAASNETISLQIQERAAPWDIYFNQTSINLTTTAQSFGPYTFTASSTSSNVGFLFNLGQSIGTYYLDNVQFYATSCNPVEYCNDGIDNDGDGLVDCDDPDCPSSDNDGDGVCDLYDLDDDNDGILDDVEGLGINSYDTPSVCTIPFLDFTGPVLESGVDGQVGAIYRYATVTASVDALVEIVALNNATVTVFDDEGTGFVDGFQPIVRSSSTGIVGAEMNFKFVDSGTSNLTSLINRIGGTVFDLDGDTLETMEQIKFENPTITGFDKPSFVQFSSASGEHVYSADGSFEGNEISDDPRLRVYFLYQNSNEFNVHFQQNRISGNGPRRFSIRFDECEVTDFENINLVIENGQDFDGDGVPNHLDLDSDNDGISDLNEAGHAATDANADGVIDGAAALFGINGVFDALETSADSDSLNYSYANSESTPDNTYDFFELDSDGDGCNDSDEENISDPDSDGIAGTGVPTVDGDGLVTSISYSIPTLNYWQDPGVIGCVEICDDGVDNDGDGDIDCADSDCAAFDYDGDQICDQIDLDDDNDGIPDLDECNGAFIIDGAHTVATYTSTEFSSTASGVQFDVSLVNGITFNTGVGPNLSNFSGGLLLHIMVLRHISI